MSFKKDILNAINNDEIFSMRLSEALGRDIIDHSEICFSNSSESFSNIESQDFSIEYMGFSREDWRREYSHVLSAKVSELFDYFWKKFPVGKRKKEMSTKDLFRSLFRHLPKESAYTTEPYLTTEDLESDIQEFYNSFEALVNACIIANYTTYETVEFLSIESQKETEEGKK